MLIVDGTLVPPHDRIVAEQSKNYRYSTNHQAVVDADSRLMVVVEKPLPGNRNGCKAWAESGAQAAVGRTVTTADGRYRGTGLVIPHRRTPAKLKLPRDEARRVDRQQDHRQQLEYQLRRADM